MKKIDMNTSEGIQRLQEEMNNVFNKKKKTLELNEALDKLNEYSFFELKHLFESFADKLFETKEGKATIATYVKTLKTNPSLNKMLMLHETLSKPTNINNAELFVNEAILLGKLKNDKELNKGKSKLAESLKNGLKSIDLTGKDISNILESKNNFDDSLEYVILNEKKISNLPDYISHVSQLVEHVKSNNTITESTSDDSVNTLISNFNDSIDESLSLEERNVVKEIAFAALSGKGKQDIFENYKNKCLNVIEENILAEENIETKSRFSSMKTQISEQIYNENTANDDILRLARFLDVFNG